VSYVLPFPEIGAGDVSIAGGKGAHLADLAAHGFPVPPGFVVSAEAYREYCDALNLDVEIAALAGAPADLAGRCAAIQDRIVDGQMNPAVSAAIHHAHARLVAGRGAKFFCAVRSSATAEDLAGASFAGQHGTYYYVTADHLLRMIRRCWSSLWSPEAVTYRATHGIDHASVSMAVVVQEMVASQISGVAFSVNPTSGARDEIVMEVSWGMGAAIVDGRVTPDRYVVGRDSLDVRQRKVADKRVMIPAQLAPGSAGRLVDVPQEMRRRETLRGDAVRIVAEWTLKCESHFGAPQDVEWSISDGSFHLLQSRPITTLGRAPVAQGVSGKYVLFKAVAENFTDPLTPLMVNLFEPPCRGFLREIGGRFYLDLDVCRRVLPFEMTDAQLAAYLYSMFSVVPARLRLAWSRLPTFAPIAALGALAAAPTLARTRDMPDDFMEAYRARCRDVDDDPSADPIEALQRLGFQPGILEPIGCMPVLVNVTAPRFTGWMAALRAMLGRWAPAMPPETTALLCAGSDGVLSADMGHRIEALAQEARGIPQVAAILTGCPADEALGRLQGEPAAKPFVESLQRFLAVHGHRAIKEFEIRAARFDENPAPVLAMIRNLVASPSDAAEHADKAVRARHDTEAQVDLALARLPLAGLRRRLVRLAAARTRYYLKLRENSRFYHIMAIGVVRRKVLAVEAQLLKLGALKCRDDIFFLQWPEIAALRAGTLTWLDVEGRVRDRRMEHVRLSKLTPPRTIGVAPDEDVRTGDGDTRDLLAGEPASPGVYRGVARVVLDPAIDAALQAGEVLVAPYTDPAWTPLFLTAGAAIIEVGSYLSHAGTVAREYGMPCVVDVADCTQRIQTGMIVEVDGDRGRVKIMVPEGVA